MNFSIQQNHLLQINRRRFGIIKQLVTGHSVTQDHDHKYREYWQFNRFVLNMPILTEYPMFSSVLSAK